MKSVILFAALTCMPAFAADRCETDFRRGVADMKNLFSRLSPACRAEVDKGDGNEGGVIRACSGSEISVALDMQKIEEGRLTPLCEDRTCDSIRKLGVCVEGQTFTSVLKKLGM